MTEKIIGLSADEVEKSRLKHGDNSLSKEKTKGFLKRFFENLNDPIIKILIAALAVEVIFTFGHCNFFEVGGIVVAILLATTVSTFSEWGSERAFAKMQEDSLSGLVRVLRDGEIKEISPSDLVVGDVVYLFSGEKIQADGIMISGSIRVDQSALNGESCEVSKAFTNTRGGEWLLSDEGKVYRGSVITAGEGIMRVMRTGGATYYGMVAKDVQTETRESPLKLRLSRLAHQISRIGYIMAAVVAATYLFNTFVSDNGFVLSKIMEDIRDAKFVFSSLIHALTLMITVVVVAAPEGLPMMITVVLSANMRKMLRDGVLVKKLVGIETAGSMNILFTDKTGTLTTGKLECERFILSNSMAKSLAGLKKQGELYKYILLNAKYNIDVKVSAGKIFGGNGTDRAIAEFFKSEGSVSAEVSDKQPFTSEKKYSSVTLENGEILIKGAPEIILSSVEYTLTESGEKISFSKAEVEKEFVECAREGNRVIAFALKATDGAMIFLCLAVLKDKIRRGVSRSVKGVKSAGVQVVMLTGDGKETATAIARECGIIAGRETVLTSSELAAMSDEQIKKILPSLAVVARALPQDKTRLVRLSQELDLVVGMTGDGINDAPSLKLADIGFAMGSGADIAKSAGDIILLDNSFFSINRTILYGRTIFKSIRKFIVFQLTMNLAACGVSLFGQFLGIDSPITIIQMLWVNIIMDTLGGLAFAGEAPLEYYMKERPKRRTESILSREMLHQIIFTGSYTLALCILFLTSRRTRGYFRADDGNVCFMTAFYALFIFSGIFNCFGARCERMWIFSNIRKNKPFVIIMALISVIQIIMIYFGGEVFRSVPLLAKELLFVIILAFSVVPFEICRRMIRKLSK